jgi:hypothetical protein
MPGQKDSSVFFATQTHFMTEELLNALDCIVWSPGAPEWFQDFFKSIADGQEFTVTAEQASWILTTAEQAVESREGEDSFGNDDDFQLIYDTFDDYSNFVRMSDGKDENSDIAKIIAPRPD